MLLKRCEYQLGSLQQWSIYTTMWNRLAVYVLPWSFVPDTIWFSLGLYSATLIDSSSTVSFSLNSSNRTVLLDSSSICTSLVPCVCGVGLMTSLVLLKRCVNQLGVLQQWSIATPIRIRLAVEASFLQQYAGLHCVWFFHLNCLSLSFYTTCSNIWFSNALFCWWWRNEAHTT